jgi:hypothetical protein
MEDGTPAGNGQDLEAILCNVPLLNEQEDCALMPITEADIYKFLYAKRSGGCCVGVSEFKGEDISVSNTTT